MEYAKLYIKKANGITTKLVTYNETWKLGRYLLRYYKGIEVEIIEIDTDRAVMLAEMGFSFKFIV